MPTSQKMNSKTTRPNNCVTERHLTNFAPRTLLGNSTYARTVQYGKNPAIIGDSHVKRIHRNGLNQNLLNGKAFFRPFDRVNVKRLSHYIIPTLVEDKPDAIVIHIGPNDISTHADPLKIANDIIKIGWQCRSFGVDEVFISSVLIRKDMELNVIIRQINEYLKSFCEEAGFYFIDHSLINMKKAFVAIFFRFNLFYS